LLLATTRAADARDIAIVALTIFPLLTLSARHANPAPETAAALAATMLAIATSGELKQEQARWEVRESRG
jgi:hypothetical protein